MSVSSVNNHIVGKKFGKLTVIKIGNKRGANIVWVCQCECGNICEAVYTKLNKGLKMSCGCLSIIPPSHGMSKTRIYMIWRGMIKRTNPKNANIPIYRWHAGKGISVDPEWLIFENFLFDMIETYQEYLTLERINGNKDYSQSNCKWATQKEQQRNRSDTLKYIINGIEKSLPEWVDEYNTRYQLVFHRLRDGWDIERALITKPRKKSKNEGE